MTRLHTAFALSGLFLAMLLGGCSKQQAAPPPPAAPVSVAKVEQKAVPLELRVIGAVEAYSTVDVKAQVDGQLTEVHFTEGQDVRKGQLLFTIDRQPFEADLRRAEASLARNQAEAQNAQMQAARYTRLVGEGVVAKEQYEDVMTKAEALEAAVRADKAAVENAKVRLAYTSIHSPIDGRTGSLRVHRGNIVKANDEKSTLVVINQLTPIYSSFALPEQDLSEVRRYMGAGKLKVEATIPRDAGPPAEGLVTFVDNAVDRNTGTIRLKATFPNNDRRLWPGQFVNVVLTLAEQKDALVVPSDAVQTGQQGLFVWVVKPDLTVESRPVTVARTRQNESVIAQGVSAGDTVVTDGHLRLMPGGRVQIKNPSNGGGGK
ncbi:MAG: efflux RND transporter periplasmic adaptor subunit [Terriglobales bacterium]